MRFLFALLIPFLLLACSPREQPVPSDTSTTENEQVSTTPTESVLAFDPTADLDEGNPEIGRAYFFGENRGRCLKCHTLGGEGDTTGTPLDDTGLRFQPDYLATFIFNPRTFKPEIAIMPPWRGDPEAKIADIVAFLMTLKTPVDHPPFTDQKPSDEPVPYEGGVGDHGRYTPASSD